jgi:hypothetical protein
MVNATGMQMIGLAFICALAVATLGPAPARNEDRLLLSLLGAVFLATILMGLLALFGVLTGTVILAAIGASIMVPCAWLVRAPDAGFDEDEEDDDGGGSPPYEPAPWDGPENWRPEPAPSLSVAMSAQPPVLAPALAPAVTRAERSQAPANPRFPLFAARAWPEVVAQLPAAAAPPPAGGPLQAPARPLNPRFPLIVAEPWSEPHPPIVVTPPAVVAPEPVPSAAPPAVVAPEPIAAAAPLSRPLRADHRSIVHRRAEGEHEGRRRRGVMRLRLLYGWRHRRRSDALR